jgi:hypothetical protein
VNLIVRYQDILKERNILTTTIKALGINYSREKRQCKNLPEFPPSQSTMGIMVAEYRHVFFPSEFSRHCKTVSGRIS